MGLRQTRTTDGRVLKLTIEAGKGNVIDGAMVAELGAAIDAAQKDPALCCIVLEGAGTDFSFGVSVPEHLPESAPAMLRGFHKVIGQMLVSRVPVFAGVRGRCLGGALELVLACGRIVAHPSAMLGLPELKLGVFAPAGSALLPTRVGQARAEEMLLSGRVVEAKEAQAIGLIDELCAAEEDPTEKAIAYAAKVLAPHSASSLRFAQHAARGAFAAQAIGRIDELERLYVEELMNTPDAKEGIEAFIAKRPARWQPGGQAR